MRAAGQTPVWTIAMLALLLSVAVALGYYVHNNTSRIQEALAAEILEQEHDVTALIEEYAGVMLALAQQRFQVEQAAATSAQQVLSASENNSQLLQALDSAQSQLLLMRSNYSFERLDGAAKAHAFVKPVLEDVEQWLGEGIAGYAANSPVVFEMVARRLNDRYPKLRIIAAETAEVATSLITSQSGFLNRFSTSLISLLGAYSLLALGILALLTRQRNLLGILARDQELHAQRFRDFADIGADWFWELDENLNLQNSASNKMQVASSSIDLPADVLSAKQSQSPNIEQQKIPALGKQVSDSYWPMKYLLSRQPFDNIESEWIAPDGSVQVMSVSGKPLLDDDGEFIGYRGVGRDITARKHIERELERANQSLIDIETRGRVQAEDAMRGSEKFLRTTLNALRSQIVILDMQGLIIETNTAWREFVREGESTIHDGGIGLGYLTVYSKASAAEKLRLELVESDISSVLHGRRNNFFHEFPCHSEDAQRWIVIAVTTFEAGDARFAVLVREDVTERRQLEERDRRLRAQLAHVSRLNTAGEMASGLAHELNQPLTSISHNCDTLISGIEDIHGDNEELTETARDIYEQSQRAGSIIRSLRQLMRKETVRTASVDLNQLVEETVRLTRPEARERNVSVILKLAPDLPMPHIDPVQIQQVLVNLERNGVEAIGSAESDRRELIISTRIEDSSTVRVTVQDSGPGFSEDMKNRVFTAFQTSKTDGMGLGLSICRSIVESHGGRLWLDTSDSAMTTFHFTLPVNAAAS